MGTSEVERGVDRRSCNKSPDSTCFRRIDMANEAFVFRGVRRRDPGLVKRTDYDVWQQGRLHCPENFDDLFALSA
jgi:hypothetical protein